MLPGNSGKSATKAEPVNVKKERSMDVKKDNIDDGSAVLSLLCVHVFVCMCV